MSYILPKIIVTCVREMMLWLHGNHKHVIISSEQESTLVMCSGNYFWEIKMYMTF